MEVRITIFEILSISSLATRDIIYIFADEKSDDTLRKHLYIKPIYGKNTSLLSLDFNHKENEGTTNDNKEIEE